MAKGKPRPYKDGEGGSKMDWDYFKRRLVEAWIHVWEIVLALILFKILSG